MHRILPKLIVAFAVAFLMGEGYAHDAFDDVNCGGLVANALVGKHLDNGPVEATEKKHADLGLKHEGSDDISDSLTYEAWTVCGGSYHLLVRSDVIHGVVRADHSKSAPAFVGTCESNGSPTAYPVFAILKAADATSGGHTSPNDKTSLPAETAWQIDEANAKFVRMNPSGLVCPKQGISTVDGGP